MGVGGEIHVDYGNLKNEFPVTGLQIKKSINTEVSPLDILEEISDYIQDDLQTEILEGALKFKRGLKEFFFSIPRGREWSKSRIMESVKSFLREKDFFK